MPHPHLLKRRLIKVWCWRGKNKAKAGIASVQNTSLLDIMSPSQVPVLLFLCKLEQRNKEDEGQNGPW